MPTLTISGNLCQNPELRYTNNGTAIATFTIANNPTRYNQNTKQWDNLDPLFLRVKAWKNLAETAAEKLAKGTPVTITGRLAANKWTTREGQERNDIELTADTIAVMIHSTTIPTTDGTPATHTGRERNNNGGGYGGYRDQAPF
ncbi:single-stranded DNA-binding protein [Nanchangia anserum]|nr:single-stranded DNA-binding protein [Nanchangia anserum]QOX82025.1 single-stranded DNA-binding protein [Nanchangia anserum]